MTAYNYDPATNGERNPFGWPPCPLCPHSGPHRHSGRGVGAHGASVDVVYPSRGPVEIVYSPRRGPDRPMYSWTDPQKAAEWFERTAAEIRAAHDLPQIIRATGA